VVIWNVAGNMTTQTKDIKDLENQFFAALDEYTCSCTVVITSVDPVMPHGSGVAVKYGDKEYILTAAHVLVDKPDNTKLRILGRPDGPLQMLRGKEEFADAIRRNVPTKFSSVASLTVTGRLMAENDDIAALEVANLKAVVPHTMLHDLSQQGEAAVSPGTPIKIFGFPGELAKTYEHRITGKRGSSVFPHITDQEVLDISRAPGNIDPRTYFVTDFEYPKDQCDPHGLSGCGGWSFPLPSKDQIWLPHSTQLLGVEIGHYESRNVLQFVHIDRVLRLLSTGG
jgi:hypothetical protein